MKLSEAIRGYSVYKMADGFSEETIKGYRWSLDKEVKFLKDPEVESITEEALRNFIMYLKTEYVPARPGGDTSPLSQATLDKVWVANRSFFNWAVKELHLEIRPDKNILRPRSVSKVISPFTDEDIQKLLKTAEHTQPAQTHDRASWTVKRRTGARDVALIYFLLDTGVRISECARLRIEDVNLDTGEVLIRSFGSGRKSRERHVYMGKTARRALWHYLSQREDRHPDDYVFLTQVDKPIDKDMAGQLLRKLGARAGVPNVHPHRFRHTFAIQYLRNGGDVFTLKRLLGHNSMMMVERYLLIADSDCATSHRHASPVDRWRV